MTKPKTYYSIVRLDLIVHIPEGTRTVLDVGCGDGSTCRKLKELGVVHVAGMDNKVVPPTSAKLDRFFSVDLDESSESCHRIFKDWEKFDVILMGDVIEHFRNPKRVILTLLDALAPGGLIITSIPNSGSAHVVDKILNQSFEYDDAGHFDRTHLRFFCREDIRKLFTDCGLEIVKLEPLHFEAGMPMEIDSPHLSYKGQGGRWMIEDITQDHYQQLATYQWLCIARKPL